MSSDVQSLSWLGIVRLGLVQASLGAIVVLTTSTLNRVMVVELALAAFVPGALVTAHHAMQALRPRMGYGSDVGRRRTPWVLGGMAALAVGGVGAALSTAAMSEHLVLGLVCAALSYLLIGGGVSAAGTSLLVLMAQHVAPARRAAASTVVWMMMIASFAITAGTTGRWLDPFSFTTLVTISAVVSTLALIVTSLAMWGLEPRGEGSASETHAARPSFARALEQVWSEPDARRFTIFVLVSMLSYSAQDLILEPFAGAVFEWTPGQTTSLSGTQHGGVFVGMLLVALVTSRFKNTPLASIRGWVVGGCMASGIAMMGLFIAGLRDGHGLFGGTWPLSANVVVLGVANGAFSIAAIASMMTLANQGARRHEGTRMGVFGAAQALGFGAGGFLGTVAVEAGRSLLGPDELGSSYALVFGLEALGFFAAQTLALRTSFPGEEPSLVAEGAVRA
ncbi:MAG: BCD family MFS transporter [Deltaproteobacteria bacterium]